MKKPRPPRFDKLAIVLTILFVSTLSSRALDLDGDGMSDVWQRVHNIATGDTATDIDGDGQSNVKEAEAGTDPRDSNDYFRTFDFSVSPAFDSVTLSWRSVEQRFYEIEESTDLITWEVAGDITGGSGLSTTATLSVGNPINDLFANRWPASTSSTETTGFNVGASVEAGEPINPSVAGGKSVWWSWSSSTSGSVTITTVGSDFDTTLAVYSGSETSNLVLLGANDDSGGLQSSVTFTAQAGVPYSIQVDGYSGATGSIVLNHPISSGVLPPPNISSSSPSRMFFRVRGYPGNDADSDGDSLLTWEERLLGTDPYDYDRDTDDDGMDDGFEFIYQLNPLSAADAQQDADGDLLSNAWEAALGLNPRLSDSDGNGISDANEDRDFDGLSNLAELQTHGTDPTQPDTDLDGLFDGWEIDNAFSALVDNTTDGDPTNDPGADPDGDGLTNSEEADYQTKAKNADSDGDGVNDGAEAAQGSNPNDPNDSQPQPAGTVAVNITFGDDSGSHSEKYRVRLVPLEGDTTGNSNRFRTNREYGVPQTDTFRLPKGSKYRVELQHVATDPNYEGPPKPDYDYVLEVDTSQGCLVLQDPDGISGYHYEGDSFFANGKSGTLYVPLFEWVTPKQSPVSNPNDTTGDGQNEFTYSTASPGVLTIDLKVLAKPTGVAGVTGHDGVKFADRCVFILPSIGGSTFAWDGANTGGKSQVSGEHLIAKATYTTLPASNNDFGLKQAQFQCDSDTSVLPQGPFEVFFPKDADNHPELGPYPGPRPPNWFYYWRQFIPTGRIATLSFGGAGYGSTNPVTRTTDIGQLASEFNDETSHRGIHAFYETVAHESHHIVLWEGWWGIGGVPNTSQDSDSDTYPDSFEASTTGASYGFSVGQNDDYVSGVPSAASAPRWPTESAGYNYEEDLCRQIEHALNESQYDSQDWSYDSTGTNQGKNHK